MTIDPILNAPAEVQLHLLAALAALALTPVMLWRPKGTPRHKALGRIWVAAMALTAVSSFWVMEIRLIGPWSPIHILSLITLGSLFQAVRAARARNIVAHKQYIFGAMMGLLGAGLFTLAPGRILSDSLFAGFETRAFAIVLVLGGAGLFWLARRWRAG
ncbi:DUF2306 domain-containing protein [Lentibacter sp.]|uniref:DUF2306 domain-containing protein n=1 Tax=Lentibacter sp. TaxID=2024994 RepID=UPI003F6C9416